MKSFSLPQPLQVAPATKQNLQIGGAFAANAGASVLVSLAVPLNCIVIARVKIRGAAGKICNPIAVTADASTDLLTKTAHGIQSGTPLHVVGGTQPGGVVAATMYYANAASADTIALYDTYAHGVAGGPTGLVDITSAGATVKVYPSVLSAYYEFVAVARNRRTTTALVGAVASLVAVEDNSAWDATAAVNDTADTLEVKVTPDAAIDTRFEAEIEVETTSANV